MGAPLICQNNQIVKLVSLSNNREKILFFYLGADDEVDMPLSDLLFKKKSR